MSTKGKIAGLANRMKTLFESLAYTFVLVLGAGASRSSGILETHKIKQEIANMVLGKYTPDFDTQWRTLDRVERRQFIDRYLRGKTPSSGYDSLVRIIKVGYFKVILTFNFDDLLERALEANGWGATKIMRSLLLGKTPARLFVRSFGPQNQ